MTLQRINLVGCGRVGQTLARLWHTQGLLQVQDVVNSTLASAQAATDFIGAGRALAGFAGLQPADLWMVGTQDKDIAQVARDLALNVVQHPILAAASASTVVSSATTGLCAAPIVFHGSGALGADQLAPLQALGWHTASAHCILSFANPHTAVAQFAGTACALEGEAAACNALRSIFGAIGAQCFEVASTDKQLYHAAAVFATNFMPVLQSVAEDLWATTGVPEPIIHQLRATLLANAAANITALGPQGALTGPAARGDLQAIAAQGTAVAAWSAEAGAAYAALSELALRLAARTELGR